MDKRSLSSGRDIRGRKRAQLSSEGDDQQVKNYSKVTIHDLYSKFIDIKRAEGISERRKKDLLQDKKYFVDFLKATGCSELMEDITTTTIREWSVYMQEQYVVYQTHVRGGRRKGLAPKTINGRIKNIKHFYNVIIENSMWERNEAYPVKLIKEPIDTVQGLTESQVRSLLKACKQSTYTGFRDYVFILLIIDSGLRQGEMITLDSNSFDFDIGVVKVSEEISKNGKSRIVPVSRKVLNLVQKLLYENRINFGSTHLFMTAYGQPMTGKGVVRQFATLRKNASLTNIKATAHALRHTFAKFYVQNGGDVFTLQKLLGHSRMDIVRTYVQMNAIDIAEAHKKFSPASKFRV
ncbi:integrase/recombinase XerD [Paenibacillaceae bacterium GAS479]|nr:integrase/recombinase XerD [Paenibacillaceae bacterium GAS479]